MTMNGNEIARLLVALAILVGGGSFAFGDGPNADVNGSSETVVGSVVDGPPVVAIA